MKNSFVHSSENCIHWWHENWTVIIQDVRYYSVKFRSIGQINTQNIVKAIELLQFHENLETLLDIRRSSFNLVTWL